MLALCAAWQPDKRARRTCQYLLEHGGLMQLAERAADGKPASYSCALASGNELTAAMLLERMQAEQARAQAALLGQEDAGGGAGSSGRKQRKPTKN